MPIDLSVLDNPPAQVPGDNIPNNIDSVPHPGFISFTPEEKAADAKTEANPEFDQELDKALGAAGNKVTKQGEKFSDILQKEKDDRAATPKPAVDLSVLDKPKIDLDVLDQPLNSEHSAFIGHLQDQLTNLQKAHDADVQITPPGSSLSDKIGDITAQGVGALKGVASGTYQALGSVQRGLMPGIPEKYQIDKQDWINKGLEPSNPAESIGTQAVGLPFAGITAGVQSLPAKYQQTAQDVINILAMAIPGLKGEPNTTGIGNKAGYTDLGKGLPPQEPPAAPPTAPPTDLNAQNLNPLAQKPPMEPIETQGGPQIGMQPSAGPTEAPKPFTIDSGHSLTGDILGTEQVGQNPFLREASLTPDENGIMRDQGLSRDVQRESYDFPKTDDLLKQANDFVADQQARVPPEAQDSVNQQQQALWEAQEQHEINKATEVDQAWRPYEADVLVQRLPAMKEALENPLGNNRSAPGQSRVYPNPDSSLFGGRPISSIGGLNRQRGAADMGVAGYLYDRYKQWFSKEDLNSVPKDNLTEISTALFRRYAPDVELGENRMGRMDSLAEAKGKMPIPKLEVEKIGDTWTVVNHDGRHRSDTLLKNDVPKMPVQLTGDVKQFLEENPKTIRSQDMQTTLPNPAHKEGPELPDSKGEGPEIRAANDTRPYVNPIGKGTIYENAPHFDTRPRWMQEASQAVDRSNPNFGKFKQGGGINLGIFRKAEASPIAKELLQREERSGPQFIEDLMKEPNLKKDGDVAYQYGLSSGPWRADTPAMKNPNHLGYRIQLFINNKIWAGIEDMHRAMSAIRPAMDNFRKRYGVGITQKFKLDTLRKDIKIALDMEGGKGWFDGTNYFPTIAQMVERGMSPESAQVWSNIHMLSDSLWDTMTKAAKMTGIVEPPRIPGWVPHFFKGPYKVRIWKDDEVGNRTYVMTKGEYSRSRAQATLEAMKPVAEANGYTATIEGPSASKVTSAELFKGLWGAKDKMDAANNKGLQALLQSMYENSAQGMVSNVLRREHPAMLGHEFERLANNDGIDAGRAVEAIKGLGDTFKDITSWYNRVKFVNEVLMPLDQAGMFKDKPNLLRNVQAWVQQYMEIPDRIAPELDRKIQDYLIRKGQDPQAVFHGLGKANSVFATAYLFANVKYYLANRLQSAIGYSTLWTNSLLDGGRGSVFKARLEAAPDIAKLNLQQHVPILDAAEEGGHLVPTYMEELSSGQFKDLISGAIEHRTRSEAFLLGYHYFKQYLPRQEAIGAAGKFADRVSVNYDTRFGTPNLISRLPQAGRPLALFAGFNQHMLGMFNNQVQALAMNKGNMGNAIKASRALLATTGMLALLYGVNGIPFTNNWEQVSDTLRKEFNIDMGNAKEWVHNMTKSPFWNHMITYGLPSTLLNFDISTSGQGASLQMPTAFYGMAKTVLDLAIASGKWATDPLSRTKESVWSLTKEFPAVWKATAEHLIKGDFGDVIRGMPDIRPGPEGIHSYDTLRTPRESVLNMSGVNSLEQSDKSIEDRQFKTLTQTMGANRSEAAKYISEGGKAQEKAIRQLIIENAGNPKAAQAAIKQYIIEQKLPSDVRQAYRAGTGSITAKQMYQKFQEIHGGP